MSQPTFTITGHILHAQTSNGIPDLRVEAWDKDLIFNDLVGSSVTDAEGKFSIEFFAAYFQECFLDRRPDLFFQVFNANNEQIASTEDSVLWNQSQDNQDIVITVDLPNTDDDNEPLERFVVKGHVYRPDGTPYAGIFVRAFDKDLRSEQALGTRRTTSQTGFYEISYTPIQFCRADKHNADLIVRAYGGTGDALLAESDIIFNAQPVEVVDLAVTDDEIPTPSDYDRLMATLQPLLRDQAIADLREDLADDPEAGQFRDLSFLSGETELPKPTLARLVMAHRLVQQAVQPEFWFALLTPTFYPFAEDQDLEQQQAELLETLPSLDDEAVRKSLTRSVNQNEIPDAHRESIDEWVEAFLEFVADQTANAEAKPTFVKLALDDAEIRVPAKRQKFARLFNQYKALSPQLLKFLEQDETFTQPEIDDLQASFQLASLTQGDFSVVKMVKTEFGVRQPAQVRQLAKKSVHDWVNVVSEKYEAGEIRLPLELGKIGDVIQLPTAQLYGQMLERQFREAFPTMAFAGGLERSLQNGGTQGVHRATDLSRFLARHDSFEFLNTSVDDFLQNGIHPDFQELAHNNAFRLELKALQRVFKLAPTFAATDTLLADNLHSAQAIYRLGESQFVRRYGDQPGFTPESARLAWNRAADTHAAVVSLITDLKAYEAQTLPASMKYDDQALADSFPNWKNLFNTGDLCECSHCNSVLSPAAYFTELLMFLEDREAKTSGKTVKDILFKRRPDLGFLELNCDNALVTLPYIDVVCEVLEAAIDSEGANHLTLPDDLKSLPEDIDEAKARVTDAFQAQGIDLGDNVSLSRVDESNPNDWVVHGDNITYRLTKRNASPPFVAEVLPNTKASAAELRAYPQYVNPVAYDTLRQAKYPFVLPFDLYAAEVRAAFQKTNLKRWELMQVFQGSTEPNNPSAGDIAAEYFGISVGEPGPSEKTLILEAAPTLNQQQERWGERHFNTLSNVNTFLRKTSLEYNDLLTLLNLKFINPSEEIFIQHLDSSCDTVQKVIQGLNATNLDRIHRFLRLWRKLKTWEMWELDLVIRQPGVGNQESNQEWQLNETFLINLFYFSQIQKQLGQKTTVEQVCALFGNLNTETHFTELHAKREDALYQTLFLNRKLIQPLETAFEVDKVDVAEPTTAKMSTYHPVIQAALRIREPDLILLKELAKATDSAADMSDDLDLTLSNLSFLWRQAWLAKTLKFKIPEWAIVLKLFQWDSGAFSTPKAAWEFLEKIDHLKASGFKLDELNWLLTGDRTAKAAPKETDATRFLTTLRQELQRIRAEYDPEQYDFLTAEPPTDMDQLTTLLTSLLQKLNRSEAEIATFLKVLRSRVMLTVPVQELPAGFVFPEEIIAAPNNIPIEYDEPNRQVRFKSLMTKAQRDTLLRSDSPILAILRSDSQLATSVEAIPTDFTFPTAIVGAPHHIPIQYEASTQQLHFTGLMTQTQWGTLTQEASPALAALYASGQLEASVEGLPTGFAFLDAVVGAPHNIPIQYDETNQRLRFTGLMSEAQQTILLNESALPTVANDAAYRTAIEALYQQSLAVVNHYRTAIEALYQQSLAVVNHYRSAIETLYQQSLTATTSHWVMEKTVDLPGVFVFPVTITGSPNAIPICCKQVLRFTGTMTAEQKNILLTDSTLAAVKDLEEYQQAIHALFERPEQPVSIRNLPENFSLPASITEAPNEIPIRLEQALRFTGVMTEDQKNTLLTDASLAAVKDVEDYQQAIAAFFEHPRLAVKFFDPVFKAFLAKLPAEIDFQGQLPPDLAAKITYDTEQEHLSFTGIMSDAEWEDLLSLSEDTAYQTVVSQLFTQPNDIDPEDERVWLSDIDLDMTQADTDTYAKRLANAVKKALRHLLKTSAENAVVQQSSAQLGLTEALSRYLLSHYAIVPYFLHLNSPLPPIWLRKPLLAHLAEAFTIDATTINAWFWANRVAAILQEWKITLAELKKIAVLTDENNEAQLLDFGTLPLDEEEPITSIDNFLQTSRLMHQRDRLPETHISLLSILNNLSVEGYSEADFAADVARLNEDWSAANMEQLIEALTFSYPDDYLLAETWERLRRAFYFLDTLNAETDTVKAFAAPVMTDADAKTLKGLLRSKFGSETWLTISTETQDVLRERKRDALAAYLLSQPQPKDVPSGKWKNTNDLYAYYLLDVEMSSCQLTSRLVQGSGSIQLFVQRCFMGLEPDVVVQADGADGDSAWRWWQWMRKYRVWEANRKVFLWPENWIEPELKKDRSSFFKDLENELLQNELNPYTIETAFTHYLEKLHDVAQLEIAGFYQEDDGDNTIIHVFGRTKGTEPHYYYYRRYDYRQWTPWEKVELDIQGDYLIPAVVNKRLFLFWPVFMEVPDEEGNSTTKIPRFRTENESQNHNEKEPDAQEEIQKPKKKLHLQMAMSDYRQGKWTPKRVSINFVESETYDVEITKSHYQFFPIDRSLVDGRFCIGFTGTSRGGGSHDIAGLKGFFEIAGCTGIPEPTNNFDDSDGFTHAIQPIQESVGSNKTIFMKWLELQPEHRGSKLQPTHSHTKRNDFTIKNNFSSHKLFRFASILRETPGLFKMSPPWQLSHFDKLLLDGQELIEEPVVMVSMDSLDTKQKKTLINSWLPFFFNDEKRTFFVLPSLPQLQSNIYLPGIFILRNHYYPGLKEACLGWGSFLERWIREREVGYKDGTIPGLGLYDESYSPNDWLFWGYVTPLEEIWSDSEDRQKLERDLSKKYPQEGQPPYSDEKFTALLGRWLREKWEQELYNAFSEDMDVTSPPYSDETFRELTKRFLMRFFNLYLGIMSILLYQFRQFHFKNFYHPFVCDFARLVYNPIQGIPALMSRETQLKNSSFQFANTYRPTPWVVAQPDDPQLPAYPKEEVDFTPDGAYSPYNWELFFHIPLLIANSLSKNQRFEEARDCITTSSVLWALKALCPVAH
jgi:DNA-binding transcriptional MerR regulator